MVVVPCTPGCLRGEAVLERLLRNERRIEGSLFRNLNELRRVHDQGRKADLDATSTLERWREEEDRARKERAFAPWRPADSSSRPDGTTTNRPQLEAPQPCDNPPWPDTGSAADGSVGDETYETNPICPEPDTSQVQYGTAVMSDSAPKGLRQTNPIWSAPRGTGIPPVSPDHGRDGEPKRDLSRLGTHAHATDLTDPGSTDTPAGQSCETNPIGPEPDMSQVLCGTAVMSDSAPDGLRKTNPIDGEASSRGRQAARPSGLPASHFTLETAAEPPCETNPIFDLPRAGAAVEPVRRVPVRHRLQGAGQTQSHSRDGPVCHCERSEAISHAAD